MLPPHLFPQRQAYVPTQASAEPAFSEPEPRATWVPTPDVAVQHL